MAADEIASLVVKVVIEHHGTTLLLFGESMGVATETALYELQKLGEV